MSCYLVNPICRRKYATRHFQIPKIKKTGRLYVPSFQFQKLWYISLSIMLVQHIICLNYFASIIMLVQHIMFTLCLNYFVRQTVIVCHHYNMGLVFFFLPLNLSHKTIAIQCVFMCCYHCCSTVPYFFGFTLRQVGHQYLTRFRNKWLLSKNKCLLC